MPVQCWIKRWVVIAMRMQSRRPQTQLSGKVAPIDSVLRDRPLSWSTSETRSSSHDPYPPESHLYTRIRVACRTNPHRRHPPNGW